MLSEKFLRRLSDAFPAFYERVNEEAMREAARLREAARGDLEQALVRARLQGAAHLWWPYVKGSVPLVGREREAMEEFSKLVLTVDHLVGYQPPSMEAARDQVVQVLRNSLDYERLARLVKREADRDAKEKAAAGATGAGIAASLTALMSPVTAFRSLRRWVRFVPPPMRVAIGGVLAAALLSVPLVAGYSAGLKAEEAARNYGDVKEDSAPAPPAEKRTRAA